MTGRYKVLLRLDSACQKPGISDVLLLSGLALRPIRNRPSWKLAVNPHVIR